MYTKVAMAVDVLHIVDVIEVMANFLARKRPAERLRNQLDIGYKIEDQSVIIHEIRPNWMDNTTKIEPLIAKATYVKKTDSWKIFRLRADRKWHVYDPQPSVRLLTDFVSVVEADKYHYFWG